MNDILANLRIVYILGLILFVLVTVLIFRSNRLREKLNLISPHRGRTKVDSFYIVFLELI
jgi:hypothetical protein